MKTNQIMFYTTLFLMVILYGCKPLTKKEALYKNPDLPVEQRVQDLISQMTLEEKVAQMLCYRHIENYVDDKGNIDTAFLNNQIKKGIGQISTMTIQWSKSAESLAEFNNNLQRFLMDETRLGIPAIIHSDATRAALYNGATLFPSAIALASSWNMDLIEQVYTIIAEESRARGVQQAFGPILDVAREPRWGRIEETFGEDPYLVSQCGIANVRAFQGTNYNHFDPVHVLSTLKHFAAYSQPERGLNGAPGNFSERILREIFFSPFKEVINKTIPYSVMISYNEIDGVPSTINKWLLADILRGEMGFKGFMVTDYGCFRGNLNDHHISDDSSEIARLAVNAGISIEYPDPYFYPKLIDLVKKGIIPEPRIDELIKPMLESKFKLDLFENPFVDTIKLAYLKSDPKRKTLALEAAQKSIILLKNTKNTLPVKQKQIKTIAVIGPHSKSSFTGNVCQQSPYFVNVTEGLKNKLGNNIEIVQHEGCRIVEEIDWRTARLADEKEELHMIHEAVKVAKKADIVILTLGGNSRTENFNRDRPGLGLIGMQERLAEEIFSLGKPVILLLFGGKPYSVPALYEKSQAVLFCWYLGQETGNAIADVLAGNINPSGKLTITIPRSSGHLPAYYNHKPQTLGDYVFDDSSPLYPFGFGLSFTQFEYKNLHLEKDTIRSMESCRVSVEISNEGKMTGDEIVQLYIRDLYSSVTRPVKELKDFHRIHLEPGETKKIEFVLLPEKFKFYDINMNYTVEPGDFDIMVGGSSVDYQTVRLNIID
ncbi:glycoside hydrolase family 3 N-terminal domain-containing protein [Bacteroidota bacterium]